MADIRYSVDGLRLRIPPGGDGVERVEEMESGGVERAEGGRDELRIWRLSIMAMGCRDEQAAARAIR